MYISLTTRHKETIISSNEPEYILSYSHFRQYISVKSFLLAKLAIIWQIWLNQSDMYISLTTCHREMIISSNEPEYILSYSHFIQYIGVKSFILAKLAIIWQIWLDQPDMYISLTTYHKEIIISSNEPEYILSYSHSIQYIYVKSFLPDKLAIIWRLFQNINKIA